MKNTGICPKCGSTDVHRALHSNTNHIRPVERGLSSMVYTTHYVCRGCGYIEEWVASQELPALRRNFKSAD